MGAQNPETWITISTYSDAEETIDPRHDETRYIEDSDKVPPTSPERARTPTMGFDYDYATDAPPDIQ